MGLLRARGQPIKRAVFLAKITKIRPYSHRLTSCALDQIVGYELAAVRVKIVMQPGMQGAEFIDSDFLRDVGMPLERRRTPSLRQVLHAKLALEQSKLEIEAQHDVQIVGDLDRAAGCIFASLLH